MNLDQIKKYRAEWGKVAKLLKAAGKTAEQIEAARHAITLKVCGRAKSSADFTRTELDGVLAKIAAIHSPADFDLQMRQQDQPEDRRALALERCQRACAQLAALDAEEYRFETEAERARYIAGICRNVIKKELERCDDAELSKVAGILGAQVARLRKRDGVIEVGGNPF